MRMSTRNIRGERVERTVRDYPYSYDPFVVFKSGLWEWKDEAYYSDRLHQQEPDHYNKCCEAVWGNHGQNFSRRKPEDIERFLRLYFRNERVILTGIEEGCNVGNGYPFWVFYIKAPERSEGRRIK